MKFPQGEGSAVIHRKKNRPALQRRDILTVFLASLSLPPPPPPPLFFFFFFSLFFIGNFRGCFDILSPFFFFVALFISDSVDFSCSGTSFFLFFSGIFHASSTVLFFLLVLFFLARLHSLLKINVLNSLVGDTWQRLWRDDFTHNGKQAVNRLKIPQGLSTLMFRRWSEVPSRGGVRGDSP